jgi:hypothetical protein
MFTTYPKYSRYRTLALTEPVMQGEDVFALQTALNEIGVPCGIEDGVLGLHTSTAIRNAQAQLGVVVDGKAGGMTQRALAMRVAEGVTDGNTMLTLALKGQMEHESGFRLGNYSPLRADNSYDAGVCQRNTQHTPAKSGFTVPDSIEQLAHVVQSHYELFSGVHDVISRWRFAQGAWNAPAFACYLAREEGATKVTKSMTLRPTDAQRATFETYMAHVSVYLL